MTADAANETPVKPTFYRITLRLLWALLACVVVTVVLFLTQAAAINASGGWGWLFAAAVLIALAALMLTFCAVSAAVSILRREPHRGKSIAILVACSGIVWLSRDIAIGVAGGVYTTYVKATAEVTSRAGAPALNPSAANMASSTAPTRMNTLDSALLNHFRDRGLVLIAVRGPGEKVEWMLKDVDPGKNCKVLTGFMRFPADVPRQEMQRQKDRLNAGSVLNESARLLMFYPYGRHNAQDGSHCDDWTSKSGAVGARLTEAFQSYREPSVRLAPVERR